MKKAIKYVLMIILILIFGTGLIYRTEISALNDILKSNLRVSTINNETKEIYFLSLSHIGKSEYYKKVIEEIKKKKEQGAVLFYETIKRTKDLSVRDSLKFIKIKGELGTAEDYAKTFEELDLGLIPQDTESFLNLVNSNDYNIDVSEKEFIELYENLHGEIGVTDEELRNKVANENLYNKGKLRKVLRGERNKYLAKSIVNSNDSKIIVLYGAMHLKGLLKELKVIDSSWRISNEKKK